MEHTDELSIIGHVEVLELSGVTSSGAFYVHRNCLEFSPPFQDQVAAASSSDEDKEQLEESRVKGLVVAALARKCAFCSRHGASIPCKVRKIDRFCLYIFLFLHVQKFPCLHFNFLYR